MTDLPFKAVRRTGETCHFGDRPTAVTWAGDYGEVTEVATPLSAHVEAGQVWRDAEGPAEVLAVACGYAMLKRRRRNPFIASVSALLHSGRWSLEKTP